jgi:hypothetical protein
MNATSGGELKWESHRKTLRRRWWFYAVVAAAGAAYFIRNLETGEPNLFAVLLLIPLLAIRQAWKTDRQIVACDRLPTATANLQPDLPRRSGP